MAICAGANFGISLDWKQMEPSVQLMGKKEFWIGNNLIINKINKKPSKSPNSFDSTTNLCPFCPTLICKLKCNFLYIFVYFISFFLYLPMPMNGRICSFTSGNLINSQIRSNCRRPWRPLVRVVVPKIGISNVGARN